jgi:hypothetical protein
MQPIVSRLFAGKTSILVILGNSAEYGLHVVPNMVLLGHGKRQPRADKPGAKTMNATEIKNEIERLAQSRKNQVNVEFEGYDPGHEMPQDRKIAELIKDMHDGGHVIIDDEIYSHDEIQTVREAFNGKVKQYMADNPGQGVPTATMQKWEKEVGMKCHQIKNAVKTLGM